MLARRSLSEAEVERAIDLARRRTARAPLQYVTGIAGFRRIEVAVGPGVLIPRPETEVVAGVAIERLRPGGVLVDAGTGSGAIALAVASERPDARVLATDRSVAALGWARRNRSALGLQVEFIECDLLTGIPTELRGEVGVVVSNPPYVAAADAGTLPAEVVDHEPHEALFGGADGLDVVRRLVLESPQWLAPGGWLVVEIGEKQGAAVTDLLEKAGFEAVSILPDLAGRDRIAEARIP